MIIDTDFGQFEILKNHREGFDLVKFHERYVDVTFDKFTYIVGDMSSGLLRLKGFNQDPKSTNGFKRIPDYLNESCNMNCPYFVIKRVKDTDSKDV
ncbi:MAG: YutD family protein [Acholeplasmataceae bacterium]|nr:YutD family protein [Acholeplasmataceae bacterium]